MSEPEKHYQYVFGEFTLDTRRGTLQRNSTEIKIRAQSFQVLALLLSRRGSLVSKDELHREIWGNKVVSDDSITHCLLDIRKCLGDSDKRIIRTMPRRGYIFEHPCEQLELEEQTSDGKSTFQVSNNRVVVAVSLLVVAAIAIWSLESGSGKRALTVHSKSIAVLPFADVSETRDQQYLATGLAAEVLNLLSQSPELRVIARSSSFAIAKEAPDIATVREALRVAFVLEGSVRRSHDRLHITVHLIDTANSANVWSKSYEGSPESIVSLQKKVADEVLITIAPGADGSLIATAQRSFSADELMLLARFYEQEVKERPEVDEALLDQAIGLFRDAVEADPGSAVAHSRLASALLYAGDIDAAEEPVFKAQALDPNLSEVQETLGEYYWLRGQPGAGAAWMRALELNPNNADALSAYAYWYWLQANDDGPEEMFRRALDLDPLSLTRHAALGNFLAQQAMVEETYEVAQRIEDRFDNAASFRVLARLMELTGDIDLGIVWAIRASQLEPENTEHRSALAELYAEIGDFETALSLEPEPGIGLLYKMRRYEEMIVAAEIQMIDTPEDAFLRYLLAFAYNATGRHSDAVRALRAIGQPYSQRSETRQPIDVEGFVAYIDALNAGGETQRANELAEWFDRSSHTNSDSWWIHVYRSCALAILERDEEALQRLERIKSSPRIAWESPLMDLNCFRRYRNNPRYQSVLADVSARRAKVRERLPETLAKNLTQGR